MNEWSFQPATDLDLTPLQSLRSVQRESGLPALATCLGWSAITHAYLAAFHRLCVHGREHLPKRAPCVLVANHTSHLDALAMAQPLSWQVRQRLLVLAAGDTFFNTPVLAALCTALFNALPIRRGRCGARALRQLRQRLVEEPCAYILFPEGTRSRTGMMARFKGGLGMLVAASAVPVVPCHLSGAFEAMPAHRRWPRPHPLELRIGKPLRFDHVPNRRQGWARVAVETEAAVRALAEGSERGEADAVNPISRRVSQAVFGLPWGGRPAHRMPRL